MCDVCSKTPCMDRCPNAVHEAIHWCCLCDSEIYEGEDYLDLDDGPVCMDCVSYHKKTAEREDW